MPASDTYPDSQVNALDYLCVDAFIRDIAGARALGTALESGLIDYLRENRGGTSEEIRIRFRWDSRGLHLLLALLGSNHVVEECGGKINLTGQFMKALPYGDLLKAKIDFANFVASDFTDHFTTLISSPDRFGPDTRIFDLFAYNRCFDHTPENYALTKRWMRITTCLTRYEALACMEYHDFRGYQRMLDIGGNSGEFVLQVCRKYPEISATVFDLPLVCDIGLEHVSPEPEAGRITFARGNALEDILPGGSDLISFKSMLHDWPEKEAEHLIRKAGRALKPGGELLIFERGPIELDEKTAPYSMIPFLLFFRSFRSPLFYRDRLSELGFQKIRIRKIDLEMPFFLVTASKES